MARALVDLKRASSRARIYSVECLFLSCMSPIDLKEVASCWYFYRLAMSNSEGTTMSSCDRDLLDMDWLVAMASRCTSGE